MNLSPQKRRLYIETKPCSNTEVALIYIYIYTYKDDSRNCTIPLWAKMVQQKLRYTTVDKKWYTRSFAIPLWREIYIYIKWYTKNFTIPQRKKKKKGTPRIFLYNGVGVTKKWYSEKFHYCHCGKKKKKKRNDTPEISPYHCGNNNKMGHQKFYHTIGKKKEKKKDRKRRNH